MYYVALCRFGKSLLQVVKRKPRCAIILRRSPMISTLFGDSLCASGLVFRTRFAVVALSGLQDNIEEINLMGPSWSFRVGSRKLSGRSSSLAADRSAAFRYLHGIFQPADFT